MKKILVLSAAFVLMSTSNFTLVMSCNLWAYTAIQQECDVYGEIDDLYEYNAAFNWYLDQCNEAGGSEYIEDPVYM